MGDCNDCAFIKMNYTGVKCKKCGVLVSTHINGYCITCHCNGKSKSVHDEFIEAIKNIKEKQE